MSDLQVGMIHGFDLEDVDVAIFDLVAMGRTVNRLAQPDQASLLVYTGVKQADGTCLWLADPGTVNGLQSMDKKLGKPANVPPFRSYHIEYDELYVDDRFHGHFGDVAVWSKCGAASGDPNGTSGPGPAAINEDAPKPGDGSSGPPVQRAGRQGCRESRISSSPKPVLPLPLAAVWNAPSGLSM